MVNLPHGTDRTLAEAADQRAAPETSRRTAFVVGAVLLLAVVLVAWLRHRQQSG